MKTSVFGKNIAMAALLLGSAGFLAACFSSSDDDASLTLSLTDAPVDEAEAVVVRFTGVELQHSGEGRVVFEFDEPREIDLLALQGEAHEVILDDESLPAGEYQWIQLNVEAQRGVEDSYIETSDGGIHSLYVPSGAQSGLRLVSGFTLSANDVADFTIDFDLRKSVHRPGGAFNDYFLRPALRLVDNTEVGTLAGSVSASWAGDEACTPAVYVYEGHGAETGSEGSDNAPVTSSGVAMNEDGIFLFEIGFLLVGDYTAAFTCEADEDDPEEANDIEFLQVQDTAIEVGETTEIRFEP
ncbi:hypothetical protein J2T60_001743 [Natronospira proteinivora]|uniref:DUF4382 domain-containing protein n=1 Tax=Natronospira proteinivora TaxID=1807133 RepID=A0ABT1GBJ9_9GAMM|nr:DUF4382 domain-containing protein [Natronospira proteinivora]MCP1727743.1 hypothetical protein [Natronospira proteinivora]